MPVSNETRRFNKKWINKQKKMHKEWSGYYWGMTIAAVVLLILLIYALIVNYG